jgi:hypothetical protein
MIAWAIAYATAGFYVGPLRNGSKHPGSVLGDRWHAKTSRDPKVIAGWFAGTDYGLFLHVGRSGCVAVDVDDWAQVPDVLKAEIERAQPPYQSTRPDEEGRGHYLFAWPPGRVLGNSTGGLGKGWGEIRGLNGVIVVEPSRHASGGAYRWLRTGPVPVLGETVATLLPDGAPGQDAATDDALRAARQTYTGSAEPNLMAAPLALFSGLVEQGQSRHESAVVACCWLAREAAAGFYPLGEALDRLRATFVEAMGLGRGGARSLSLRAAQGEFEGIAAWALGQVTDDAVEQTRARAQSVGVGRGRIKLPKLIMPPEDAPALIRAADPGRRPLSLTPASDIAPEAVQWLWRGRIAAGTIALLAGREGLGKSSVSWWVVARITRGELPGYCEGTPRNVLVSATEDSWAHVIVPKLMAVGADLTMVYRIEVLPEGAPTDGIPLELPYDLQALELAARDKDAALAVLDPVISRLSRDLDTHKDGDVRRSLEPLAAVATRTNMAILGLIHHNKSGGSDPLNSIMGSKAFTAMARSVHSVVRDPDDEEARRRLFGTVKNNLGPSDLPLMAFRIVSSPIDGGAAGILPSARIEWLEDVEGTIDEMMQADADGGEVRTAVAAAAEWLQDYLSARKGVAESKSIRDAGRKAGHAERTLYKARQRLKIAATSIPGVFPHTVQWSLKNGPAQRGTIASDLAPVLPSHAGGIYTGNTGNIAGQSVDAAIPVLPVSPDCQDPTRDGKTGPCLRCGTPIERYGPRGHPMCDDCQPHSRGQSA